MKKEERDRGAMAPKPSKIPQFSRTPSPSPSTPQRDTGACLKITKKKKSCTSAALEGGLKGIKSRVIPRVVKCLKVQSG